MSDKFLKDQLDDMNEEAKRELDACETETDKEYWDGYNQAIADIAYRFSIELNAIKE